MNSDSEYDSDSEMNSDSESENSDSDSEWPLERLTIELIREKYWDPVTKTCEPIKYIYAQCYDGYMPGNNEFKELVFTGALITGFNDRKITKDWLSLSEYGPYKENGSNKKMFYFLETVDKTESDENMVQIGWCGLDLTKNISNAIVNNFLSFEVLDGLDLWVLKE